MSDPRAGLAAYYDLEPEFPNDIPFYRSRLPSPPGAVLELGCGTGRVSVDLAKGSSYYVGLDHSPDMSERCRARLEASGLGAERARVDVRDITDFALDHAFDLVVAPYRVLQNLESDDQVRGLFKCIRAHLSPSGRCILNAFCPNRSRAALLALWSSRGESESWSVSEGEDRVVCIERRAGIRPDPLTLLPELVYRRYRGDEFLDESVLRIAMRCYYPDELLERIRSEGFRVFERWGGYGGEAYGAGPELVVEFGL